MCNSKSNVKINTWHRVHKWGLPALWPNAGCISGRGGIQSLIHSVSHVPKKQAISRVDTQKKILHVRHWQLKTGTFGGGRSGCRDRSDRCSLLRNRTRFFGEVHFYFWHLLSIFWQPLFDKPHLSNATGAPGRVFGCLLRGSALFLFGSGEIS